MGKFLFLDFSFISIFFFRGAIRVQSKILKYKFVANYL